MVNYLIIEVKIQFNWDSINNSYSLPIIPVNEKVLTFTGSHTHLNNKKSFWKFVCFNSNLFEQLCNSVGKVVTIKGSLQQNFNPKAECSHKNTTQIIINSIVEKKAINNDSKANEENLAKINKKIEKDNSEDLPW